MKLEARTNALESQTGSGMSEDAIMKRLDAISTRDAVPATQRQQELREKEERLLSRAGGADESKASDMSNQERSDFLNFVTACPRLPPGGLGALGIEVTAQRSQSKIPTAQTCVPKLYLPEYADGARREGCAGSGGSIGES